MTLSNIPEYVNFIPSNIAKIKTIELIEKFFPNNNIRYIAINDGIDTFIDNTNNDIAPFKAILNDMYAKDISKKIKSSLHSRMKDGLYVSEKCPFGYMKDPNNKNHLVINEEQAEVVKLIFDLVLKDNTYHYIAQYLTERKIKTPAAYYNYVWNTKCINTNCISQVYWRVMKKRLKDEGNGTVTNCNALKLKAQDGKYRMTDVVDIESEVKYHVESNIIME